MQAAEPYARRNTIADPGTRIQSIPTPEGLDKKAITILMYATKDGTRGATQSKHWRQLKVR
jgi:hypothetical protein